MTNVRILHVGDDGGVLADTVVPYEGPARIAVLEYADAEGLVTLHAPITVSSWAVVNTEDGTLVAFPEEP